MKKIKFSKTIKIVLIVLLAVALLMGVYLLYLLTFSKDAVPFDTQKLIRPNKDIEFYDTNNNIIKDSLTSVNKKISISKINEYTKNAFISVEDKRFYSHNGIDLTRIGGALLENLRSGSSKEGASTISQQLIKNTHLSNEKSLSRKLNEVRLSLILENTFSKDEILEMYLNTIYFGNNAYGIESASQVYFNKSATELTLAESATLAAIIKAPSHYSPDINVKKCTDRRNLILKLMLDTNLIADNQYDSAVLSAIETTNIDKNIGREKNYIYACIDEICDILNISKQQLYKSDLKIKTYFNKQIQQQLVDSVNNYQIITDKNVSSQKGGLIADNKTKGIVALYGYGNGNIFSKNRLIGSISKPISCYAPAIDSGIASPLTPVLDEPTTFNDYSPHNINDKYYGWTNIRYALAHSLNVPAVKTLSTIPIDTALYYLKNNGINISEHDRNLSIGLGSFYNGVNLYQIVQSYMTFANNGDFNKISLIKEISDESGHILYSHKSNAKKVFSLDTAYIMTNLLQEVTKTGTAKKLNSLPFEIAGKTGTVGAEKSKGNKDCFFASYTSQHSNVMWVGNNTNDLLANNVTGSSFPTLMAKTLYEKLYANNSPDNFIKPNSVETLKIDKIKYLDSHVIELANYLIPENECINDIFSASNAPTIYSNRYSLNAPLLSVKLNKNNKPIININSTKSIRYKLHRIYEETDTIIADLYGKECQYIDDNVIQGEKYIYYAVPVLVNIEDKNNASKLNEITIPINKFPEKDQNNGFMDFWLDLFN